MAKDKVSPYWKYFIVPIENDDKYFYVKRVSKSDKKVTLKHTVKKAGYFSGPEEYAWEDTSVEWLFDYDTKWSKDIQALFGTEYHLKTAYKEKFAASPLMAETIIYNCIENDLEMEKASNLSKNYEQRLIDETREVPPYKAIKQGPPPLKK